MINSPLNEARKIERCCQMLAGVGLVNCEKQQKIINKTLIYSIGINVLLNIAFGASLTAAHSTGITLPVTLGVASLGIIIYNITKVSEKVFKYNEAKTWYPIYEAVIRGQYTQAYSPMKNNIEAIKKIYHSHMVGFHYIKDINFISPHYKDGEHHEFFLLFDFYLTILYSLQNVTISKEHMLENFGTIPDYMCDKEAPARACKLLDDLKQSKEKFVAKPVKSVSDHIFKSIIYDLKNQTKNTTNSSLEVAVLENMETIKNYLFHIQKYSNNFSEKNQKAFNAILHTSNAKEMSTAILHTGN